MLFSSKSLRLFSGLLACAGLVLLSGCSGGKSGEVSGTVIGPDGKPLPAGKITFSPTGKGKSVDGTISDGTFKVAKVPTGEVKILIGTTYLTQNAAKVTEMKQKVADLKRAAGMKAAAGKNEGSDDTIKELEGQISKMEKEAAGYVKIDEKKYGQVENTPFTKTITSGSQDIGELKIDK